MTATTTSPIDAALAARAAHDTDICVIPIRSDGSKKPIFSWKQYQQERPTRAQVEEWFGPHQAVAVICGAVSGGLVMIEMEGRFCDEGYWARFREAVLERIPEERWNEITRYVELSPSGGPHIYVRCPGFTDGNEKLAKAMRPNPVTGTIEPTDIMETRGEGGYSVIAGSIGHHSGNAWTVAQGAITDVATVTRDELDAILEAARTLDELPEPEPAPEPRPATNGRQTPAGESWMDATVAAYNDRHSVLDELPGWSPVATETYRGENIVRVHRDGSDNDFGATVYASGRVGFFSSNAPAGCRYYDGRGPVPTYDAFTLALLAAGKRDEPDDRVAFALDLRRQGYGPPLDEPKARQRSEPAPLGATPPAADPTTGEIVPDDGAPIPLDRFDLPKFPLDVLPKWMRAEVVATAEAIQAPIEIPAGLTLVALSTACAGKVDVDGINYRQPSNVYMAIVAASGIGKSPVASRMLSPLYDLEEHLAEEAKKEIAEAMAEQSAIEEQITAAKHLLKKDPGSAGARSAIRDAELARLSHEVPATPRLIADDHTPEALGQLIAGQKGTRMAVLSPEGATLFSSMTGQRYKGGGDAPPEVPPVYLKSWGGEQMPIDRKGAGSVIVKRPILTVGVLVQPFVVDRLAMTPQIAAQGALARFLWIVAEDNVGQRDRSRRRHTAPLSSEYVERLTAIARRCLTWQMPACLVATDEAADHLDAVNEAREARMGLGGDLDAYREIEAKLVGYQWRLAGLLAMAYGDDLQAGITLERAQQAERLADYFLAHSIAVHRRAGVDERGGTLRACAAYVARHAGEEIDWRDFQLAMRSTYISMSDAQVDLAELVRMRWLVVEDGDLAAVGVKGKTNPTVKIDARTRAFSAQRDGA